MGEYGKLFVVLIEVGTSQDMVKVSYEGSLSPIDLYIMDAGGLHLSGPEPS